MERRNLAPKRPKPFGRPLELRGLIGDVARAVGGTGALSALIGCHSSSLERWCHTRPPPQHVQMLLVRLAAEYRLPNATFKPIRRDPAPTTRTIRLPGALGDLARAAGGTKELAALIGVIPRTIQFWGRRSFPIPKPVRMLLARLAAEYGLPVSAQRELEHFSD